MIRRFLVAGSLALALGASALAQSSLTVHRQSGVPLPGYVTSSDHWLDPGNVVPEGQNSRDQNYARMVEDPIGNIVPVGPDLGPMPWN